MKKLYSKGAVHPSPSPPPSLPISEQLSLAYLPAAILTLATALTAEDKEVLAYLLSCSATSAAAYDFCVHGEKHQHHPPSSACHCFSCYTSFWARWDSSPNRQLIHEIIDALEDGFFIQGKKKRGINKRYKRRNSKNNKSLELNGDDKVGNNTGSKGSSPVNNELGRLESNEEDGGQQVSSGDETGEKQGSVRKIVSFIGERIWGSVWG